MDKVVFKDIEVEHPNRYRIVPVAGQENTYDVAPARGKVTVPGNPVRAKELNDLQNAVEKALNEAIKEAADEADTAAEKAAAAAASATEAAQMRNATEAAAMSAAASKAAAETAAAEAKAVVVPLEPAGALGLPDNSLLLLAH